MIEYTYFELFLLCAFFVVLAYMFKFREESRSHRKFISIILSDPDLYNKIRTDLVEAEKEIRNAH